MSYNPKSRKAEEFISHEEILESLAYAKKNKDNRKLAEEILEKQNWQRESAIERLLF